MKRVVGYVVMAFGILIFWPLEIGLCIYALFYIIGIFLDAGLLPGLISIGVAAICLTISGFILFALQLPLSALAASLLEKTKQSSSNDYYEILKSHESEWHLAAPERRTELQWRSDHWHRFMEDGLSPSEADKRARELDYNFWLKMSHEKP